MTKHKIVLYNPSAVFYTMPLALVAVASNLDSSRYDVKIIDARIERNPLELLLREAKDALCLGITVLTGNPINDALRASREVKKYFPGLPVIWGGWHPSLLPAETLNEPSVDITVQGQGEVTFAELVERLANGESLEGVEGVVFKPHALNDGIASSRLRREQDLNYDWLHGSQTRQNLPRALVDMNSFQYQRYGFIDVERYFKLKKQRQFDYISSAGCYFRCTFCADPFVYNRKWSALEPERMCDEIEMLWRKYKFDELAFQDETFFTHKKRVLRIAEEFLRRGFKFKWTATMRADQGYRLSEDVIKLLVKSGLRWVLIGVESGSQEMLNWMKKDITVEQVLHCADFCKRYGIDVNFPSIVGFPGEPDESVDATLSLVKKLRQMSPKFETPVFYFKPYPGSEITLEVVKRGFKLPQSLEEWAGFDYIGSSGPWVSAEKYRRIERFKFYNRFAGGPETFMRLPLRKISRWRLNTGFFKLPFEKYIVDIIKPLPRLS